MTNLGISKEDIAKKTKKDFEQPGAEESVIELRYKHYQTRLLQTINRLLQERKIVKDTIGPQLHLDLLARSTSNSSLGMTSRGQLIEGVLYINSSRNRSNVPKQRRIGIHPHTGSVVDFANTISLPSTVRGLQTQRSSLLPQQDFFKQLNRETIKVKRMKQKQEEIAIKKLEKESQIRRHNEELQKKWEKLEKFELDYRKELYAKNVEMSQRREEKIQQMKKLEKEKERQLEREQEKINRQMHEKAKNFTMIEIERQREIRKKEEEQAKKREETIKRRERLKKQEMDQLERKLAQIEHKFKKGEELSKQALEERKAKAHEKNEQLIQHIMTFKQEKQRLEEEKNGQLGQSLLKFDQRMKQIQDKFEKNKRDTSSKKLEDHQLRFKEAKLLEKQDLKQMQEQLENKLKQMDQNMEQARKEREHEIRLKQEMRKLKQEDLKKTLEQKKRQDINKKMSILQKEKEHMKTITQIKMQKDLLLQAKNEQQKQLLLEKKQIDEAIQMLMTLSSKQAKEKYLKDNFNQSFIDKLKTKVPMLLQEEKRKKKCSDENEDEKEESQ